MGNAPFETMQFNIPDSQLEVLKAQEQQAREDLHANPDVVFYQEELKAAREAVRAYIQQSQQASAENAKYWHELRMRNASNTVGLAQIAAQENVAHNWIGACSMAQHQSVSTSFMAHSLSLAAMSGNDQGYCAMPVLQNFAPPSVPVIQPLSFTN